MANPTFNGASALEFNKSSAGIYVNFGTLASDGTYNEEWQYVGKTQNAKTLTPILDKMQWEDNETGVAQLYVEDVSKTGASMNFSFMQWNLEILQMALNAEQDTTSDATYNVAHLIENPDSLLEFGFRAVGKLRDGRAMIIEIYKASMTVNGDISLGEIGSYSEIPVMVSALKAGIATPEAKQSFGRILIEKSATS